MTRRPARLRLRRRLVIYSAPLTVLALLIAVKLISVAVVGHWAASSFARGDGSAVRADAAILGAANLVEPAKAPFAAGAAAVLDGRLEDADAHFADALARSGTARSCPVRVNLELVRETQGDRAAAAPPPPPPLVAVAPDGREIPPRRLDPANGDPLDKLQQVLQDAAGAAPPGESP